jgi:hypothetical protein
MLSAKALVRRTSMHRWVLGETLCIFARGCILAVGCGRPLACERVYSLVLRGAEGCWFVGGCVLCCMVLKAVGLRTGVFFAAWC